MADVQVTADEGVRRRDFLNVAAVSFAGVGAVAAIALLLWQMAPKPMFSGSRVMSSKITRRIHASAPHAEQIALNLLPLRITEHIAGEVLDHHAIG